MNKYVIDKIILRDNPKGLNDKFFDYLSKLIYERYGILDLWAREIVPKNCVPPIKGEVTKGKMKWRGIYLTTQEDLGTYFYQRCKRISPILTNNNEIIE